MRITCISASNVQKMRGRSASTRACELVRDIAIREKGGEIDVKVIPLVDHELRPCTMCGECFTADRCVYDDEYNAIYQEMAHSDGVVIVVPHYAPLPAKLMILFEKLQERVFLLSFNNQSGRFPLQGRPAAVIAHGGMNEDGKVLEYYDKALLEPVAGALRSCGMEIVDGGKDWPRGVAFGIKDLRRNGEERLPVIEHDWDAIQRRLEPLVINLVERIS